VEGTRVDGWTTDRSTRDGQRDWIDAAGSERPGGPDDPPELLP
jgi:hypothetical protein